MVNEKIICKECKNKNLKSTVQEGMGTITCMYCAPFYDEKGNRHHHDSNKETSAFICSNGHVFSKQKLHSCWCGWKQKP